MRSLLRLGNVEYFYAIINIGQPLQTRGVPLDRRSVQQYLLKQNQRLEYIQGMAVGISDMESVKIRAEQAGGVYEQRFRARHD
jgi:hypothetical protein